MGFSVKDLGAKARAAAAKAAANAGNKLNESDKVQGWVAKGKEKTDSVRDAAAAAAAAQIAKLTEGVGVGAGRITEVLTAQAEKLGGTKAAAAQAAQEERNSDGPFEP